MSCYCCGWLQIIFISRLFFDSDCFFDYKTTPGSVSLVHGFIHGKSVPYLFSTAQARSQQQIEILIHLLKKLASVKDISGVLCLVDHVNNFSTNMVRTSVLGELRMRQQNTKATVPLDVVPERRTERCSPRFRPGGRFWSQVSDTCRQAGRERNVGP